MDLEIKPFSGLDLNDPFFDNLRDSYTGFDTWFRKKAAAGESAYVFFDGSGRIIDFLYMKIETGELNDVIPVLPPKKRLKVGTFKIISRETSRGERFIKKIMDRAVSEDVDEIYVTIFPKEELKKLISIFEKYGFKHIAYKLHHDKEMSEYVLVKNMHQSLNDIILDYPFVRKSGVEKRLLAIRPEYHTKLFPDSILNNESYDVVQDVSSTNSIYKIYICWMKNVDTLKHGDLLIIYRMKDDRGPAEYRSVATSLCTVDEVKVFSDFHNEDEFVHYVNRYSVFSENELRRWYKSKRGFVVIKMLYNAAFSRRVIRKALLEQVNLSPDMYWGFAELSDEQFNNIVNLGGVNERYFID